MPARPAAGGGWGAVRDRLLHDRRQPALGHPHRPRRAAPQALRRRRRATAALISDLKTRGMLEDTLVIWGGEFGRTPYAENRDKEKAGRDHHHTAFCTLLAGGGVKGGLAYGSSDELG